MIIMDVFYIFISIFLILTIHELGHYYFAKKFNLKIRSVVIGRGPVLYQGKIFKIKLFPIDAYTDINNESFKRSENKNKIFIILGGSLFNLMIGIVIFFIMFLSFDKNTFFQKTVYLKKGDKVYEIKKIFNHKIYNYENLQKTLNFYLNDSQINEISFQVKDIKDNLDSDLKDIVIPVILIKISLLGVNNNSISFFEKTKINKKNNLLFYYLFGIGIMSFILGILNLIPLKIGKIKNDGYILVNLIFNKEKD